MATSTTFVLANEKVGRRSGQICLHGPEDFAAMPEAQFVFLFPLALDGVADRRRGAVVARAGWSRSRRMH